MDRFLIPAEGPDPQAIAVARREVIEYCRELPKPINMVLLTPVVAIRDSVLEEAIGEPAVRDLERNKPMDLAPSVPIIHESIRTFNRYREGHIILGLWASRPMLDVIDAAVKARAAFVIPLSMDEVQPWITTWNPRVIGQEPAATKEVITNALVRKGLRALTHRVNLATGLTHPNDKDAAISLFKLFVSEGLLFDPNEIRTWALQNGWTPEYADRLAGIAADVTAGKRLRCNNPRQWNPNFLRQGED